MGNKFFYDPINDREWQVESGWDERWIRISESQAAQLTTARSQGARIYVDINGIPQAFNAPAAPTVAWNERAELTPYSIEYGVPQQHWQITRLSAAEQGAALASLRWIKQNSGLVYRDADGVWQVTLNPADVTDGIYIRTDALTMTTLGLIKSDFDIGINIIRNWKVRDLFYVQLTNEELTAAYRKAQEHWQMAFDIETNYGTAIVRGENVNINDWCL